jgi:hypothetical protein
VLCCMIQNTVKDIHHSYQNIEGDIKEQALLFVNHYKYQDNVGEKFEGRLLVFAKYQKERIDRKEISPSTVPILQLKIQFHQLNIQFNT